VVIPVAVPQDIIMPVTGGRVRRDRRLCQRQAQRDYQPTMKRGNPTCSVHETQAFNQGRSNVFARPEENSWQVMDRDVINHLITNNAP
jgi:hypothetical protein